MLLMCKYGNDNLNNLRVNAKQDDFLAIKFKFDTVTVTNV